MKSRMTATKLTAVVSLATAITHGVCADAPPDILVSTIGPSWFNWEQGDYRAYAVAHTTCNVGGEPLVWSAGTNQHPVYGQNMFRVNADGIEQIGQGWLLHGFCALSQAECGGTCQATDCGTLGAGCSSPNSAATQGSQISAGPKHEVNATTGAFPYPPASPPFSGFTERRLRVLRSDVTVASNPGAVWFIEGQRVHFDDAPDDGGVSDNASYRQVLLDPAGAIVALGGPTVVGKPAIDAWKSADPAVRLEEVKVPGEGSFFVASRAFDQGDGTWRYEYAVQNIDVHRAAGAFAVPVVAVPTAVGFHDVDYHSGELWDDTDWTNAHGSGVLRWSVVPSPTANALRWGTLYNFRFTATAPPGIVDARLELHEPGSPAELVVAVVGPASACAADLSGNDVVDFADVLAVIGAWGPCLECAEDLDGDHVVGFGDVLEVIAAWGPC
ncbi:MAG: hypothetical protein GY715_13905 [Planctomycetes bacterium]|nr:hypothetical protein [Planctomycetota bacterium]